MKLLLISVKSDRTTGGIAMWTEHFLSRCRELDIECSLVNTELLGSRVRTGKRSLWGELVRTWRIFRRLRMLLKTEHFDFAYLNTSCGTFGLFRDCKIGKMIHKYKVPIVTQYHCEIPYWIKTGTRKDCLGRLAALSHRNLVLCQKSKDFLWQEYKLESVKVPNFLPKAAVRTTPKPISPEIRNICFVGCVSEKKGAAELYEVAARLPHITFRLVGQVSHQVAAWEKPDNIQLLGAVSNELVIEYLDQSDLFLFPSYTEGCSMALMEAMARGLPCIATDVGANADMLSENCGIIVEKENVDALVSAVWALENPEQRKEMSEHAVQKVSAYYTEQNVDRILALMSIKESK